MYTNGISAIALSIAVVSASAWADGAKTREQVKAELLEAIRTGDLATGESSLKLNELYPNRYPPKPVAPGKSRAEVKAEYEEAVRSGDIAYGESSLNLNELYPDRYPPKLVVGAKTRAQVKAELAEAIELGDIFAGGESNQTLAELYPQRYAAVRARHAAAKKSSPGDAQTAAK